MLICKGYSYLPLSFPIYDVLFYHILHMFYGRICNKNTFDQNDQLLPCIYYNRTKLERLLFHIFFLFYFILNISPFTKQASSYLSVWLVFYKLFSFRIFYHFILLFQSLLLLGNILFIYFLFLLHKFWGSPGNFCPIFPKIF